MLSYFLLRLENERASRVSRSLLIPAAKMPSEFYLSGLDLQLFFLRRVLLSLPNSPV